MIDRVAEATPPLLLLTRLVRSIHFMTRSTARFRVNPPMSVDADAPSPWRRFTQAAFILSLVVVIARLTSVETLRDPWDVAPGSVAIARGAGPATGLVIDLLAVIPALLVLARRVVDRDFRLASRWSHLIAFALAVWVMLSTAWSSDRFAAIVSASHLLAGISLMWAVSQLVRSAVRLRLVAAVCFGLLLVLAAQAVVYQTIDVPANIRYWNDNRAALLKERGWAPGSFSATQLERKITSGEIVGFFTSPNTFGAIGVMLFFVAAGIGLQKIKDRDVPAGAIIITAGAACVGWITVQSRSKTAGATPMLGIALLILFALLHAHVRRRSAFFYWIGTTSVALALAAVVAHGIYRGGLFPGHFSNSLDFRWKYWVAATHIFQQHAVTGIGWANFGLHYVGARLPEASEEVKDPHNFLVRFFVEAGLIGGMLAIAWLLRVSWEMTRPADRANEPDSQQCASATVGSAAVIALAGILLSVLVNVDFTQAAADVVLEMLRRLLYLLALILGTVGASMLSPQKRELDARPAPWLHCCVLIGLGLFLVHNLIDFSLFEVGPMYAFLLLAGAAVGVAPTNPARQKQSRAWATAALLAGGTLWLIAVAALVAPVMAAEQSAFDANEQIRTLTPEHPEQSRLHYARAARELQRAFGRVPYNADYALRAARSAYGSGDTALANDLLAAAIRANPLYIDAYLMRSDIELRQAAPDPARVRADFETILRLNPNDVSFHKQYGEALERFGLFNDARLQYELALKYNAALPQGEPKRLAEEEAADLSARIARLSQGR